MDLERLRGEIDSINGDIVRLVARRLRLMTEVAEYKFQNDLEVTNRDREEALIQECIALFKEEGFDDPAFVRELFELLIKKCTELQVEHIEELKNGL